VVRASFPAVWTLVSSSGYVHRTSSSLPILIVPLPQDLSGAVTSELVNSPSRVLDLAITPDGKRLVAVGRADVAASSTVPHSLAGSVNGSRGVTPAPTPPVMARLEKRISVFSLSEMKLELYVPPPLVH
jgi:hypothetical protein